MSVVPTPFPHVMNFSWLLLGFVFNLLVFLLVASKMSSQCSYKSTKSVNDLSEWVW